MNDRIFKHTNKEISEALRDRVLDLTPEDLGFAVGASPEFLGGMVEFAHDTRMHSLVVLVDGSVSLYDSEGHGSLGCGNHRDVRTAADGILRLMRSLVPASSLASGRDSIGVGTVGCHLLTNTGRRWVDAKLAMLDHTRTPLRDLYFAAQSLIALIERVQAGQSLASEIELAYEAMEGERGERCWSVGNVAHRLRI